MLYEQDLFLFLAVINLLNIIFVLVLQSYPIRTKSLFGTVCFLLFCFFWGEHEYKLVLKSFMTEGPDRFVAQYTEIVLLP